MTDSEDISSVAQQLAELTHTVEEMQSQLEKFRFDSARERESLASASNVGRVARSVPPRTIETTHD